MTRVPRRAMIATAICLSIGSAGIASAASNWSKNGTGAGAARASQLQPVSGVTVGSATASSLTISWSSPSVGVTTGLNFAVYRSSTSGGTYSRITDGGCAAPATSPCTDDSGLSGGTQYFYEVFDTVGTKWSATAPEVSGTTAASGVTVSTFTTSDQDGKPEQGDTLVITFSGAVKPSSICSSWTSGANVLSGTTSGNINLTLTKHASAHDTLSLTDTSDCSGGLHIFSGGSLDLGQAGYVASTPASFDTNTHCNGGHPCATVSIDTSDTVVTITFGEASGGSVNTVATNPGVTFVPDAAIRSAVGSPVTGTATDSASKFF